MAHKLMKELSQEEVYGGADREEDLIVSVSAAGDKSNCRL